MRNVITCNYTFNPDCLFTKKKLKVRNLIINLSEHLIQTINSQKQNVESTSRNLIINLSKIVNSQKQVYIAKKQHPYDCFTNLSEDKSIPTTALWCPAFSNHG